MLSPRLKGEGEEEMQLQPPPMRKEYLADSQTRWVWFLYPEIICYMLEIDKINIVLYRTMVRMNIL